MYFVYVSMMISGKYFKIPLIDMHKLMKEEFGNIVIFPGMLGRKQMAMTYNVEDAEKVLLNPQSTDINN